MPVTVEEGGLVLIRGGSMGRVRERVSDGRLRLMVLVRVVSVVYMGVVVVVVRSVRVVLVRRPQAVVLLGG